VRSQTQLQILRESDWNNRNGIKTYTLRSDQRRNTNEEGRRRKASSSLSSVNSGHSERKRTILRILNGSRMRKFQMGGERRGHRGSGGRGGATLAEVDGRVARRAKHVASNVIEALLTQIQNLMSISKRKNPSEERSGPPWFQCRT